MYITESQGGNTCKKNLTENKSICKKKKMFSIFQRQQGDYGILPAQVILVSIWRWNCLNLYHYSANL